MTGFFLSVKSPQCTESIAKKKTFDKIFPPRVLMSQKCEISLSVGYKTVKPKRGDWEWKFHVFGTSKHGEEKSLLDIFLLYLSVHCGDVIEQIKKICHIHFT